MNGASRCCSPVVPGGNGAFYFPKPVLFQSDIVVVVHVVDADNGGLRLARQQPQRQIGADEPSGSRNQYAHGLFDFILFRNDFPKGLED